jgi:hypothetical protein
MSESSRTSSSSSCRPAASAARLDAFHGERGIPIRRGRGRHEVQQFHVRFCFPDAATADAFHERFGGKRLTHSPFKPGRPAGPRVRYQRSYSPRSDDKS